MGLDEKLESLEETEAPEMDAELADEEIDFEDEEEYEDDELGPDALETDLEDELEDDEEYDDLEDELDDEYDDEDEDDEYDDEDYDDEDDEEYDDEDEENEFDFGITKEGVAEATDDFNTIYKEGAATVRELKDAFDDIKSAFDLGGLFKK